MTATEIPESGLWDVANGEYHADRTADSHSTLDVFRASVPRYAGIYVHGTFPKPEPTGPMLFGSAFGVAVLEPEKWGDLVAIAPDVDRRTKAGKEEWSSFSASCEGRLVITQDDFALISAMKAGLQANPHARQLLETAGKTERSVRWTDRETGLPLKARFDKLCDCGLIVDLKTTADPSPEAWAKSVVNFGYHRQDALYLAGAWEALKFDGMFVFIAVGKEPPHETVVYELDDEARELGRDQNSAVLKELSQRKQTGDWSSRWSGQVLKTRLPKWAFYQG